MESQGRSYSPQQAQTIREAFLRASRSYARDLTRKEREKLAQAVVDLAAQGCEDPEKLASRAVIRSL
jgi:hypothetical protein